MTRLFASLGILIALEAVALADDDTPPDTSVTSFDPDQAVAPISAVEGPGIKIGEGTVLHPVFGLETGYTSNVFYSATDPVGSAVLRALAQVSAGSLTGDRLRSPEAQSDAGDTASFEYRASVRASYDAMLSGDSTVRGTGGLGLGGTFHGLANPGGPWTFGIDEDYSRIIRAANFETDENLNRDINTFALNLLWHPADRAISAYAYYNNTVDVFEQNLGIYPDRLENRLGLHPQWRIFPQTQIYVDVSWAIYSGLGATGKDSSYPLTAVAGIQTLLSLDMTLSAHAGYTNGFYTGPSYSAPTGGVDLGYRYSPFGRILVGFDWIYSDSINANYYRDAVIRALLTQQIKPVTLVIEPELYFRQYDGISAIVPDVTDDQRNDTIVSIVAGIHYSFRNWIAATLDYRFTDLSTPYRYPVMSSEPFDPSYIRHDVLLGVRVAM